MDRILLLLDNPRNRALVAEWLAGRYETILPDSADALRQPFDLGIVDGPALDRLWSDVQERRRQEQPIFLPFLLVTPRPDVRLVTRHIWRTIDELIPSPVEKLELYVRVEIMLRARRFSLELRDRIHEAEHERRRAEAALESKGRLIRGLSHDLKDPLGAVQGYVGMLQAGLAGPVEAEQREWIRRVGQATGRTLRIIDDLLELTRAESGQLSVKPVPTDVGALVRDLADENGPAASAKELSVDIAVAPELPRCNTDPNRVRQILGNLISNAIKYTPRGGRIELRVEADGGPGAPRPGPFVAVSVTDTGPGIPPHEHERIFEEFTRPGARGEPGVGLGLAISRTIARLLGGDVTVRSRPGHGSTFTLWIPLESSPAAAQQDGRMDDGRRQGRRQRSAPDR